MLDSVATALKNACSCNESNHLVIASAEKAALSTCRLTMCSCKEGLSLPLKYSFEGLLGKRFAYLQRKHKETQSW